MDEFSKEEQQARRTTRLLVSIIVIATALALAMVWYKEAHGQERRFSASCDETHCMLKRSDLMLMLQAANTPCPTNKQGVYKMALCKGGKLRSLGDVNGQLIGYGFNCPGCQHFHAVYVAPHSPAWQFNGDTERPTFSPSLLLQWERHEPPVTPENYEQYKANPWPQTKVPQVCHSYIRDGRIEFLGDCTHDLRNQTVDLPLWDDRAFEDHHE